jgi:uncharacterized membrane protein
MSVFDEFLITVTLALDASVVIYVALSCVSARHGEKHRSNIFATVRWVDTVFLVLVAGYTLVLVALTVLRYYSFSTATTDLSQYDQLVWNSLHGRLLENSYIPDSPQFLGKSFSPILIALVPLYALWSSPVTLLIIQTFALAIGSFPIYWFAREQLGRVFALVVAVAYFLFPAVWYVNLDEFHEIALATPLLAFSTYLMFHRRYKAFLICLAVTLLVKEEIAFIAVAFGAFIFLFQSRRALGLAVALTGGAYGLVILLYVTPFFRGAAPGDFYYFGNGAFAGRSVRYGYLGHSFPEIVTTVVTRPDIVLEHVLIPGKIEYVMHLLVPLAFLPLIGADVSMLALPTLGYTLLSDYIWQYDIRTLYPAPLIPFMFFSAIVGLQRILAWRASIPILQKSRNLSPNSAKVAAVAVLILVSSALSYLLQGPGPLARNFQAGNYIVASHALLQESWLRSIPSDAVVVAQNEFLAHVSNRKVVHEIPAIADYRQADYIVYDDTRAWYGIHGGYWNRFLGSNYFEPVIQQGSFVIAKRRVPGNTIQITYANQIRLHGCILPIADTLRGGMIIRPILNWQAISDIPDRYLVELQLVDAVGHVWAEESVEPEDGLAPTNGWRVGGSIIDQYALKLPPTMPAGDYRITVGLRKTDVEDAPAVFDNNGKFLGTDAVVAAIYVEKNKNSFTASEVVKIQPMTAYFVDMGEMRFLGYVPPRQTISPGDLLQMGVYWRAREKPQGDYVVAVQLRDANGRVKFEQSDRPAKGTYPTMLWDAGEVLLDWHDFVVPSDVSPGNYAIVVVLRNNIDARILGEVVVSSIQVVRL